MNKNKIKLCFFNKSLNFNLFIYVLHLTNNFHKKLLKKFLYENGIKTLIINKSFKIGLKFNYIYKLLKLK